MTDPQAPQLRVYDHFDGKKHDFAPLDPARVTMYVCGMTVQGPPHMGHMLAFVSADLVRRTLEFLGYTTLHVQNFTDIDDKIIVRAVELGTTPTALAQQNIDAYLTAADALNIRRAHDYPRVTDHIEEIVAFIGRLIDKGNAYASGGNVWFDVRSYEPYGRLSNRNIDDLRTGVRVELDESKRDPLDFALWKASRAGEPSWDSPWGPGRPGWHIECSVMSTKYLGETFDFHGGGRDLIFPHHENELAQSCALGGDFVRYWMHNGLLTMDGQKMAKSTGHFFSVEQVLGEFDADVVRYYLLRGHFRNQMEYSRERLEEAAAGYDRMRRALVLIGELASAKDLGAAIPEGVTSPDGVRLEDATQKARNGFVDGLCDDFNAEAAMAALYELIRVANPILTGANPAGVDAAPLKAAQSCLTECLGVLGLFESVQGGDAIPAEILELAMQRDQARADRDFKAADDLRDRILGAGYRIEDTADGTKVRRS